VDLASASFVWGIEDIIGAKFSTVFDKDGNEDEETSSWHMGLLFSVIGVGWSGVLCRSGRHELVDDGPKALYVTTRLRGRIVFSDGRLVGNFDGQDLSVVFGAYLFPDHGIGHCLGQ
jgi:hypothetical protein